jgi:hypothetical protein
MTDALFESSIQSLPLIHKGKVRDIYAIDDKRMLIVTTDRLSAFDVVLPTPIPDKGKVLTAVADFWFGKLSNILPNQLTGDAPESVVQPSERDQVAGRAIVVKRLKALPVEAIVRGYLVGSGWADYQKTGKVCGIPLPPGLRQADKLARAPVHALHQGRRGRPRREHRFRPVPDPARPGNRRPGPGRGHRALPGGRGVCPHPGHHHRRHQVRIRSQTIRPEH